MAILLQLPSGQTIKLESTTVTIGSDPGCDVVLPEQEGVQSQHAKIRKMANKWMIESEGDWPIRVGNGVPGRKSWLKPGDEIHLTESGIKIVFNLTQPDGEVMDAADMALGEEGTGFPAETPAERVADQEAEIGPPVMSVSAAAAAAQAVTPPPPPPPQASEPKPEPLPTPTPAAIGSGPRKATVSVPSTQKPPPPIPESPVEGTSTPTAPPAPKRPPPLLPDEVPQRSAGSPVRTSAGPPPVPKPEPPMPPSSIPPALSSTLPSRLTTIVEQVKEKARTISAELPKVAEAAKTWAGQQAGAVKEKVAALKAARVPEQGWHYAHDGARHGPVSLGQLKELAASGQLLASDLVWRDGMSTWAQADTVEGLYTPPRQSGPPPLPPSEIPPTSNPAAISGTPSRQPPPLVSAYEHREVVEGVLTDLANRGVSRKAAAPLLWRIAWKIGLHVPPPHLMPFVQLALFAGFAVALVVGVVDLLFGSLQNAVQNALVIGVLAGIGSSIYYRHSARKIGLPNWDNYPKPGPVDGPALWNPIAAGLFSFMFSWAFGGFILARNWRSLGEPSRAFRCMIWFYSWFGWLLLGIITPDTTVITRFFQVSWYVIGGIFFFVEVVPQHRVIRERFRDAYPHKRWSMPIGIGVGCFVLLVLAATLFQSGSPTESGADSVNFRATSGGSAVPASSALLSTKGPSLTEVRGAPSGARELEVRVHTVGVERMPWFIRRYNASLQSVKCYATSDTLIIDLTVDESPWMEIGGNWQFRMLVRLFDRNGEHLTHFTTAESFTALPEAHQMYSQMYDRFVAGRVPQNKIPVGKPVLLKPTGNRLQYQVNVRDLRDTAIVELGFIDQK